MTKKAKVTLQELAVVAEEKLGIPVTVAEPQPQEVTGLELSEQAKTDIEIELAYLEGQIKATEEAVMKMVARHAKAHLALKEIQVRQAPIAKAEGMYAKALKELEAIQHCLLGGTVIKSGVQLPKFSKVSPEVAQIEALKRQFGASKNQIANVVSRDYGFEDAADLFALLNAEKENANDK